MSRRSVPVVFVVVAVLLAIPCVADVGPFASFSATATPGIQKLTVDATLTTSGAGSAAAGDNVLMVFGVRRTDNHLPYLTNFSFRNVPRDGSGVATFSNSFTFTGLDPAIGYKWGVSVFYDWGTLSTQAYFSWLAFSGSWYDTYLSWLASNINNLSTITTISNLFPSEAGPGGRRWGVYLGRAPALAPIPTLSTWGLLVLGVLLTTAGVLVLRRH